MIPHASPPRCACVASPFYFLDPNSILTNYHIFELRLFAI